MILDIQYSLFRSAPREIKLSDAEPLWRPFATNLNADTVRRLAKLHPSLVWVA